MQQKFYSPMQSMNAFMVGDQMGQQKRKRETQNAFSQMIGDKDYSGARDYAYGRGDMQLGQGADSILAGQAEQQKAQDADKARMAYEGLKAVSQETDFQSRMQMAQQLSQQLGIPAPDDPSDLQDHVIEQKLKAMRIQGGFEETGPEYGFMNVDGVGYRTNDAAGTMEALTERYIEPEEGLTEYQEQQLALQRERLDFQKNKPAQNGITIGPDGTIQIGGPNGGATTRYTAAQDASQLKDARDRANNLAPVLNTMYAARAELLGPDGVEGTEDDLDTGSFAGPIQLGRRLLPGEQENETRYDNFDALSKEFGIEKLAGIGGNDTERELLTAIQTGPNIGAQEGSNLSRINRQIAVFEFIGESRRNFMSRWQQDHGSLSQPARKGPYAGMTFDEAMSVFQRAEAQRQGLLGAAPAGQSAPDSMVGVMPQQGDLTDQEYEEYLALQREINGG